MEPVSFLSLSSSDAAANDTDNPGKPKTDEHYTATFPAASRVAWSVIHFIRSSGRESAH